MKKIGFLSFGHWSASPYSQVRSGSIALIQEIELAEAVEDLGADGAYFRVHHFAQQLASPFPLLAAIGTERSGSRSARPSSTCVREPAVHGRGCWCRRPHRRRSAPARDQPRITRAGDRWLPVLRLVPPDGQIDADMARQHADVFLEALSGIGFAQRNPNPDVPELARSARDGAPFRRLARSDLVGRRITRDRGWTARRA